MVRHTTSTLETVLTYASFLALSIALHMIVILGSRPEELEQAEAEKPKQAQKTSTSAKPPTPKRERGSVTPDALLRDVLQASGTSDSPDPAHE